MREGGRGGRRIGIKKGMSKNNSEQDVCKKCCF